MICMPEKAGGVGRMSGDAGVLPECGVNALMTPDHIAKQASSSG